MGEDTMIQVLMEIVKLCHDLSQYKGISFTLRIVSSSFFLTNNSNGQGCLSFEERGIKSKRMFPVPDAK